MAELYPYPRFSFAERDRRWKAVRELMRQQRLDVIVTPQNSGHSTDYQANSRYLTHVGEVGMPTLPPFFRWKVKSLPSQLQPLPAGRRCRTGPTTCARRDATTVESLCSG